MANGFSTEQMLEIIMGDVKTLAAKHEEALAKLNEINANGCAKGQTHTEDIKSLFTWRDKAIIGFIALLLSAVGSLGMALFTLTRK